MGIRDFIDNLEEHREKLERGPELSAAEREEMLGEAEMMVGMAEAAVKELDSVLNNRRINLHEEHSIRFSQDVFRHLIKEEEKLKVQLHELASR
ncbi:MAG: hypothetical protein ACR2GU_14055 [Rubrobacteraceae bacterium]